MLVSFAKNRNKQGKRTFSINWSAWKDNSMAVEYGVIASRVSYILNLKGAAIVVDTACSSSLVAIYQACSDICLVMLIWQ